MKQTKDFDYRQARLELDELLAWFESGEVSVDEAIAKYQQADILLKQLQTYLGDAQRRIKQITKNSIKTGE
jgi:exodeoxyribonuclease VII small subunit